MRSSTVRPLTVAALAVVLVACVACGGDDAEDASPAVATTVGGTGPAPTSSRGGSESDSEFCRLSRSYADRSAELIRSGGAPYAMRQIYQSAEQDIREAYEAAPTDLKPDVKVLADAVATLVAALDRVNWDFNKLPAEAFSGVNAPQFRTAGDKLETYARDNCGVD